MRKILRKNIFCNVPSIIFFLFCTHMLEKLLRNLLIPLKTSKSHLKLPFSEGVWTHKTTFQEFKDETNLGKKRDFEKMSLTKVMEIFDNYYAKISFRGMCTVQKILGWHFGILTLSYTRHFPSFLVLGLILVHTALLAKDKNCAF